jgi:hypothetical protein
MRIEIMISSNKTIVNHAISLRRSTVPELLHQHMFQSAAEFGQLRHDHPGLYQGFQQSTLLHSVAADSSTTSWANKLSVVVNP